MPVGGVDLSGHPSHLQVRSAEMDPEIYLIGCRRREQMVLLCVACCDLPAGRRTNREPATVPVREAVLGLFKAPVGVLTGYEGDRIRSRLRMCE